MAAALNFAFSPESESEELDEDILPHKLSTNNNAKKAA